MRFFIINTTVFKFYELRGGGPAGNRAAIILIDCDFAKPGRRPYRKMYDAEVILAVAFLRHPATVMKTVPTKAERAALPK
jgi:hypothetical protein